MKRQPRQAKFYRIANAASDEAELFIYDEISWWGIAADQFVRDLQGITAPKINLRLNSPGGNVFDGIAIYNALRRHPATVTSHVDGVAASIASVIALAGDEVRMSQGAMLMIHNAWGLGIGDADEMRKTADLLDKATEQIRGIYRARTGKSDAELRAMMDAETWMDADEAIEHGFANEMVDKPAAEAAFDFSMFRRPPEKLAARAQGSAPRIETVRDFEAFLRDAGGFSRAAAAAIASGGFRPSDPRDEDEPPAWIAGAQSLAGLFTN